MSVEEHLPESASRLDLKLLEEIANVTPSPLVLHGGSGIHPDDLRESFKMNVVKVNKPPGRFGAGRGRSIDGRIKHSSTGHKAQESDGNLSARLIVGPLSHAGNLTAISSEYYVRPATATPDGQFHKLLTLNLVEIEFLFTGKSNQAYGNPNT